MSRQSSAGEQTLQSRTSLPQELREHWLRGEGAAIELKLKRALALTDCEMKLGLHALLSHLDERGQKAHSQKRRREAKDAAEQAGVQTITNPASIQVCLGGFKFGTLITRRILHALCAHQAHCIVPCLAHSFQKLVQNSATWTELVFDTRRDGDRLKCPQKATDFARIISMPQFSNINTLRIERCNGGFLLRPNIEVYRAIENLRDLRRVALWHMVPKEGGWPRLAGCLKHVREASLSDMSRGLSEVLKRMTSLVRLRFDAPPSFQHVSLNWEKHLAVFSNLRHLFLRGSCTTKPSGKWHYASGILQDADVRVLSEWAPALEALDVSFNFSLTGKTASSLGKHTSLLTLRWQHVGRSVTANDLIQGFAEAPSLRRLDVRCLANCPNDGPGRLTDLDSLRKALPQVEILGGMLTAQALPNRWPKEQCYLGF